MSAVVAFCGTTVHAHLMTRPAERVPGEIILKLRANPHFKTTRAEVVSVAYALNRRLGSDSVISTRPLQTDPQLQIFRLSKTSEADLSAALDTLKSVPAVQYAEPNYVLHALDDGIPSGTPDDPDFAKSWGLRNTGQQDPGGLAGLAGADIDVLPLWKDGITGSRKILVAVLDTGIEWDHPDIQANLYTNPGEIAGNGIDDDHNGFVDDIHGWNFHDGNANSTDDNNHGTHCAGIIGAAGNNGIGIAGVNWSVSLMPVKFLGSDGGGNLDRAIDALNYARMMKARVINSSWGGGVYSQAMHDAIQQARNAGILFVAAAGNDAQDHDVNPSYPANYDLDNVVSVAATDNRDRLAYFSDYGASTIQLAAPGMRIWSTIRGGEYASKSGTSMAAPFVSGIAALVLSVDPQLTPAELRDRLIRTSIPLASLKGSVVSGGRVDANNAVRDLIPSGASGFSSRQTGSH